MKINIVSSDLIFAHTMKEKIYQVFPEYCIDIYKDPFSLKKNSKNSAMTFFLISTYDLADKEEFLKKSKRINEFEKVIIIHSKDVKKEELISLSDSIPILSNTINHFELKNMMEIFTPSDKNKIFAHFMPAAAYRTAIDTLLSIKFIDESISMLTDYYSDSHPTNLFDLVIEEDKKILFKSRFDSLEPGTQYRVNYRIKSINQEPKLIQDRGEIKSDKKTGMLYSEGLLIDLDQIRFPNKGNKKQANKEKIMDQNLGFLEYDYATDIIELDNIAAEILEVETSVTSKIFIRTIKKNLETEELPQISNKFKKFFKSNIETRLTQTFLYNSKNNKSTISLQLHRLTRGENRKGFKYIGIIQDITEKSNKISELKKAENLKSIELLAGGIAHDFNNRLQVIMGYTAMIQHKFNNPNIEHDLWNIENAVIEASDLTSKLLAYSKKGKYLDIKCDIHKIIEEIIKNRDHLNIEGVDNIILELKATNSEIKCDPEQIKKALLSIISNSIEADHEDEKITIETTNTDNKKEIKIKIIDKGIGIDENIRHRIFEPYFTTKNPAIHSGLGLPSVIGTVEIHNGSIEINPSDKKGTTTTIILPLFENSNKERTIPDKKQNNKITTEIRNRSILVIDDDHSVNKITSALLESMGYHVLKALTGAQAIELYKKNKNSIDLVLLDMVLPEMDGKKIYQELKKIKPDVKALIISGYSKDDKAQETLRLGAIGFVQKPIRKNELRKVVEQYTEN